MSEQLELLWELQKIDFDLKSIKEDRDRIPKELKRLDEKQNIEKEKIQKEKEKMKYIAFILHKFLMLSLKEIP